MGKAKCDQRSGLQALGSVLLCDKYSAPSGPSKPHRLCLLPLYELPYFLCNIFTFYKLARKEGAGEVKPLFNFHSLKALINYM